MDSTSGSNIAGQIAYDDLREWLVLADRLGEVRTVKGASWQEDSVDAASWTAVQHKSGRPGVGLRCVSDDSQLTRFPPKILATPLPAVPRASAC